MWVGEDLPQDDAVDGGQGRAKLLTGRVEGELSQELSEARQIGLGGFADRNGHGDGSAG